MTRFHPTQIGLTLALCLLLAAGCEPNDGKKLKLDASLLSGNGTPAPAAALPTTGSAAPTADPAASPPPDQSASLPAAPVEQLAAAGPLPAMTTLYTGTLEPHRRATVAPKVAAQVVQVFAREGDRVRQGDALLALDTSDIQLQLRNATAMMAAARIQLDQARVDEQRLVKLAEAQQVSASQLDAMATRRKATQITTEQAQIALDQAQKAIRDSVVRAPFNGVVVKRFVSEGERVVTMPPTMLFTIEETDVLDLRIQVSELQMTRVRIGDPVEIRFAALGNGPVAAKITRIVPSIDPRTRAFPIIVELPNPDQRFRSGMFAEVRLTPAAAGDPAPPPTKATTAALR